VVVVTLAVAEVPAGVAAAAPGKDKCLRKFVLAEARKVYGGCTKQFYLRASDKISAHVVVHFLLLPVIIYRKLR
jgi:hypothetical protein